ncbi:MAG: DEAD/DEAH box helicase family protein [Chloroflexota bacterium]|nr:DEAD/DEAH box helicase family protein [Chloroflexota bacterium]
MRYTLKDYQADAVRDVLVNLGQARAMYRQFRSLTQFSLTATTGAGKTVMAAAVIEALFFGNDEFDFAPDAGAVVLWFSDDPSLNEQSRFRLAAAASELDGRMRRIESTFSEPQLRPGNVYFLNTQKLSKNSRLVRGDVDADPNQERMFDLRPDELQSSIYDTITNTIEDEGLTLYLVLDEAHRGMGGPSRDRSTIVQRLINGHADVPPMPIVWGISATVERFENAMKDVKKRTALPSVIVDSALVQASGLLKDDIVLGVPTEAGVFDTVLLARAVRKIRESTAAWAAYAADQGDAQPVIPLLVVQVGDKPSSDTLLRTLETINQHWPDLAPDAVANVFGEHTDLVIGQQVVPYLAPERVQDRTDIRVLLAKSAISTGWDCPRAEVLVSFRPAQDRTHITQLLGRMIRTPLARRIPGNELLNSVECLLPFFNRQTATAVADMLMRGSTSKDEAEAETGSGGGAGRRVLFDPVELRPNPDVPAAVWEAFEELPSVTIPRRDVKPIRRLTALATALSADGLVKEAVRFAHKRLHNVLNGRAVEYADAVAEARDDVVTMQGEDVRGRIGGEMSYLPFSESADPRAIEDAYRYAGRQLSPALASSYAAKLAGPGGEEDALLDAHIAVAALALVPDIVTAAAAEADKLAREWLGLTRVARKDLSDERQVEYDRLESMSSRPERVSLVAPDVAQVDTKVRDADGNETALPTHQLHLVAAADGTYPVSLNSWERAVLDAEAERAGFAGWYRNPSRASKESLAVAYRDPSGEWKALRPDFVFFSITAGGNVVVDVVDPHGHHLADALPKLRGLVDFAERFSDEFRRIESIAETDGMLRVLDLTLETVRQAVSDATDAKALYKSDVASDY